MTTPQILHFIIAIVIMMNPLGSLSIFLDLTNKATLIEQRKTATQATIAMLVIMMLTLWSGKAVLTLFGITIPAFRVAGGIILLLMGFSMLQSRESPVSHTSADDEAAKQRHSIGVVPIALPVIVGPGTMSTLIIAASDYPQLLNKFWMTTICALLALSMGSMLYFADAIVKIVGDSVIKVVTRIMGMVIMAIAIGMLSDGIIGLLPVLGHISS